MADIAMVFHWPPSEMYAMDINELMRWHEKAISRWNMQHPPST
jgi:hypothetical protein